MHSTLLEKYSELFNPDTSVLAFGPKIIQLNHIINLYKSGTIFFMFALMIYFHNFSIGAWIYLALHGSYGIVWIIKDFTFPDKAFQQKASLSIAFMISAVLMLYWGTGFLMMSGTADQNPSPCRIFCCIFLYVIGLTLMICTDLQKHITLKYKKGLIDDYFLASNRNTNYLGEIMIYLSFALLVNHFIGFAILGMIWSTVFVSRIYLKEKSLKQKDGYNAYEKRSYLLLFKITQSDLCNCLLYALCFAVGIGLYYFKTS